MDSETNKLPEWIERLDVLEKYLSSIRFMISFEKLPQKNIDMLIEGVKPFQNEYDKIVKEQKLGVCRGCGHQFRMNFEGDNECGWCDATYREDRFNNEI